MHWQKFEEILWSIRLETIKLMAAVALKGQTFWRCAKPFAGLSPTSID